MDSSPFRRLRAVWFVLGLVALGGVAGCTSVKKTTEDAVAWVRGALQTNLAHSLEHSTAATTAALKDLKFDSIATRQDALSGNVTAKTAKDEVVEVVLTPVGAKQTRIDIRVGTFSDRTAAHEVLSAILRRL